MGTKGRELAPPELLRALGSAAEAIVRFERGADPRHLDEAASIFERVIGEPQFGVVEPGLGLATVQSTAMTYVQRYLATGQARELDRAVELLRSALEGKLFDIVSAPPDVVVLCLTTLGSALFQRYAASGDQDDLDEATAASRDAVDLAGPSSPYLAGLLNNLASMQRALRAYR